MTKKKGKKAEAHFMPETFYVWEWPTAKPLKHFWCNASLKMTKKNILCMIFIDTRNDGMVCCFNKYFRMEIKSTF